MVELFYQLFPNIFEYAIFNVWWYTFYPNVEINLVYYREDNIYRLFIDKNRALMLYDKYNIKELHLYKTKELLNILKALW